MVSKTMTESKNHVDGPKWMVESETPKNFWGRNNTTKTETRETNDKRDEKPPILIVQYRGNQNQLFANMVRTITQAKSLLKIRKLKTTLPLFKSSFSCYLNFMGVQIVLLCL